MAQAFRHALVRARCTILSTLAADIAPSLAPDLPMAARPLTNLLSLRGFHRQAHAAQQSLAADASAPQAATGGGGAAAAAAPGPPLPPWSPTRELVKRKTLPKRMGHLLQVLEREKQAEAQAARQHPDFSAGDFLELKLSVPENKRRTTVFKGICIARRNRGWRTSFTVRNFVGNSGGIERTFPL